MDVRSINLTLRHFSLLLLQRPPTSTLFPYTTLFRSSSDITTGAESDIQQLTRIARGMVGRWGMSRAIGPIAVIPQEDRKSTRLNSSHVSISYAVFCLKKKT